MPGCLQPGCRSSDFHTFTRKLPARDDCQDTGHCREYSAGDTCKKHHVVASRCIKQETPEGKGYGPYPGTDSGTEGEDPVVVQISIEHSYHRRHLHLVDLIEDTVKGSSCKQ